MIRIQTAILIAVALLGATAAAKASTYVVTLQEIGANVIATGNGQINLTGLGLVCGPPCNTLPGINASGAFITTGSGAGGNGVAIDLYSGIAGPTSFGSNIGAEASSGTGELVGVQGNAHDIYVMAGYVSGTALSSSAIYDNETFATLGATPGTYVWTWAGGADSFTLEIGQTPVPAALPFFATGLGGLGLLGWRRKRKCGQKQ